MIAQKNFLTILIATIAVSAVIIINPISDDESDFTHFTFDAVHLKDENSGINHICLMKLESHLLQYWKS